MDTASGNGMENGRPDLGGQITFIANIMNFTLAWSSILSQRPLREYEVLMYEQACNYLNTYFKTIERSLNGLVPPKTDDSQSPIGDEEYPEFD